MRFLIKNYSLVEFSNYLAKIEDEFKKEFGYVPYIWNMDSEGIKLCAGMKKRKHTL